VRPRRRGKQHLGEISREESEQARSQRDTRDDLAHHGRLSHPLGESGEQQSGQQYQRQVYEDDSANRDCLRGFSNNNVPFHSWSLLGAIIATVGEQPQTHAGVLGAHLVKPGVVHRDCGNRGRVQCIGLAGMT
jgi:hypothetical protein